MAYYNEIKKYIKPRTREYFELVIRDTFFIVEGCFEIAECSNTFIYLIGKKHYILIHGKDFKLCVSRRLELIFSGCIYKLERKDKC